MNKIVFVLFFLLLSSYSFAQVRFEAENYTAMSGVSVEDGWGDGSARDVYSIDQGDWMEYSIHPTKTGVHTFIFRVGTVTTGAQFKVKKADGTVLATVSLPNTGNYQSFQSVGVQLDLQAGVQTIRIESAAADNWTFNWFEASFGYKEEAEFYINHSDVNTESCSDAGGGLDVGWIDTGDWMDYSVNVETAGTYNVNFRLAAQDNIGEQLQIRNSAGTVLSTINVPVTGGWQTWQTVQGTVTIPAGVQTLRVYAVVGSWNMNWWSIVPQVTNQSPVANAGADASVTLPTNTIALNGSGSDPDGNIYGYAWTYVSGPTGSSFTAGNQAATSVNGLVQGMYVFRLTVTDNGGAAGFDEVSVTVNPAPPATTTWLMSGNSNIDTSQHFIGTNDAQPLIFKTNGVKQARLTTDGVFMTKKLRVTQSAWADFVFDRNYQLKPLSSIERYIHSHQHLPDVPSEKEVVKSGVDLGDNQAVLLQKIEEMTLYLIQINKEVEQLKKDNASLKRQIKTSPKKR